MFTLKLVALTALLLVPVLLSGSHLVGLKATLRSAQPRAHTPKPIARSRIFLTQHELTLYKPLALSGPGPIEVLTGNGFPVTKGAIFELQNMTTELLSELRVSVRSPQKLIGIGSQDSGIRILEENRFVFDPPVRPGRWSTIAWAYDDYGPDPKVDTKVVLIPTFVGYSVEPRPLLAVSGRKPVEDQELPANGQIRTLSPLEVQEFKVGGLPQTFVIRSDANMVFVEGRAVARVLVGDRQVASRLQVRAKGKELVLVIGKSKAQTLGALRLTGIQVKLTKGAFGILRVYVLTGDSWRPIPVGVVHPENN